MYEGYLSRFQHVANSANRFASRHVILPRFDEPPTMHANARSLVRAQPPAPGAAVQMVCIEYVRPVSVARFGQRAAPRRMR